MGKLFADESGYANRLIKWKDLYARSKICARARRGCRNVLQSNRAKERVWSTIGAAIVVVAFVSIS